MNAEMKNVVKKGVKVAGTTCVAAGAVALVASGAALKAVAEGGKYLRDTVRKIMDDDSAKEAEAEVQVDEPTAEAVPETADVQEEAPATEDIV